MNDKTIYGGILALGGLITWFFLPRFEDPVGYFLIAMLLGAVCYAVWYFRLPLLVEARSDDEKLVVVSGGGNERTVMLEDIVWVGSSGSKSSRLDDTDPWFEFGVVRVQQPGMAKEEVIRFRLLPAGGHLGTHPAIAKLMRRVQRRQDQAPS